MNIAADLIVQVLENLRVSTTLRRYPICFQKNILYQHTQHNLIGHNRNHPSTWQVQKGCSYKLHTRGREVAQVRQEQVLGGCVQNVHPPCSFSKKKKKKKIKTEKGITALEKFLFCVLSQWAVDSCIHFPFFTSLSLPNFSLLLYSEYFSVFAQCLKGSGPAVGLKL